MAATVMFVNTGYVYEKGTCRPPHPDLFSFLYTGKELNRLVVMSDSSSSTAGVHVLRLDPSLYKLGDEEAAFFKQSTGIQDSEKLKQHILQVQKEAYAVRDVTEIQLLELKPFAQVYPYPCIGRFGFTT